MSLKNIKRLINRDSVHIVLESVGYKVDAHHKFKMREDERTASAIINVDGTIHDFGSDFHGDIFDVLQIGRGMTFSESKELVMHHCRFSDRTKTSLLLKQKNVPRKKDNYTLLKRLQKKADIYLSALPLKIINGKEYPVNKWGHFTLEDGSKGNHEVVWVAPVFEKLFESYLIPTDIKFPKYLFEKVIGYDHYFNCPVIIIRDESERVVDIVRYRPESDGKPLPMKYLYQKNDLKPDINYLFPLQAQMQKMMRSEGYCYVGEGLKNAINASMMGIPFISIESASKIKPELITFLKSDRMKDIVLIGAFDGDLAGERAYQKISTEVPMENEFDFSSGMDFAEYLQEIRQ